MMKHGFCIGFLVVINLLPAQLFAQEEVKAEETEYERTTLFLPALGSTPETGFMFGGVVVPQFKTGGAGTETRSSSLLFSGIYTTKNQVLVSFLTDLIFPGETWMLNGNYFVNYFPESFWGIGPFTENDDEVTILYTEINIEQAALFQLRPALFAGPYVRWNKTYNQEFQDTSGEEIPSPEINGKGESKSAGVGLMVASDRRNRNLTPTRHHYVQLSFLKHPSWMGSTDPYTSFLVDTRKYIDLKNDGRSVLAIQGLLRMIAGSPSFLNLSTLGGDGINRGYYNGRYRDQNSAQIQSEFRQHVTGRLGFTVFAATGEVWNRFDNLNFSNYKWSAGAGLRFNLNKKDPTNIRIDYGTGKHTSGFYIQFGEAF